MVLKLWARRVSKRIDENEVRERATETPVTGVARAAQHEIRGEEQMNQKEPRLLITKAETRLLPYTHTHTHTKMQSHKPTQTHGETQKFTAHGETEKIRHSLAAFLCPDMTCMSLSSQKINKNKLLGKIVLREQQQLCFCATKKYLRRNLKSLYSCITP